MKKYMLVPMILLSLNSFSAKVVSNDRGVFDKLFISKELQKNIDGRFDYENDIAVISNAKESKNMSFQDAMYGLEDAVKSYSYKVLIEYLQRANLTGPGFNEHQMNEFSKKIAKDLMNSNNVIEEGRWTDNQNYYTLVKINKNVVRQYSKQVFKERLDIIIQALTELKEGI